MSALASEISSGIKGLFSAKAAAPKKKAAAKPDVETLAPSRVIAKGNAKAKAKASAKPKERTMFTHASINNAVVDASRATGVTRMTRASLIPVIADFAFDTLKSFSLAVAHKAQASSRSTMTLPDVIAVIEESGGTYVPEMTTEEVVVQ